jgi:hypothetical protein
MVMNLRFFRQSLFMALNITGKTEAGKGRLINLARCILRLEPAKNDYQPKSGDSTSQSVISTEGRNPFTRPDGTRFLPSVEMT